ncbi:MAG: hypothetical protein EBZ48_01300, partial [Proteobacteria bacterium]|nr:hypothetical protein [Pseudomonadota bacterium]
MSNHLAPLLVRANAGTGKTFALSNRFLTLLFEGVPPQQILATTFTRKAAAEIQARIFERLAEAASCEKKAATLAAELQDSRATKKRAAELLGTLVREQHQLSICTIDSLCAGILTMFAAELGFPGKVSIFSEDQEQTIVRTAVAGLLSHKDRRLLLTLLRMASDGTDHRALHSRLEQSLRELRDLFVESGPKAWQCLSPRPLLSEAEIAAALKQVQAAPVAINKSDAKPSKPYLNAVRELLTAVVDNDWETLLKSGISKAIWLGKMEFSRASIPEQLRHAILPLVMQAQAVIWNRIVARTEGYGKLLELYDAAYWEHCSSLGAFGFSDIKELLVRGAVMGQLDELYYRLDTRYAHLLLDEFQDTSMLDWKLLQPIAAEVLSKVGPEHSFLCVGDVKQAIYGFRGGVAEIFDSISDEWTILESRTLDTSYRSAPAIMEFSNRLFENLESNPAITQFSDVARRWQTRYAHHRTAKADLAGYVQVDLVAEGHTQTETRAALLAKAVVQVQELRAAAPWASIGVLVPKNSDIRGVIKALANCKDRIVASQEGGVPLTDSAAVLVFLALLTLVDHPGDTIARYHVANSPLGEVCGVRPGTSTSEVGAVMSTLRGDLLVRGYGAVIHELVRATARQWHREDHQQLLKLAELGFSFDPRRGARALEFVQLVERAKDERPQPGAVQVMTYHKSKGLEFDAVILPFLHDRFLNRNRAAVWVERASPVEPPSTIVGTISKELVPVHPLLERLAAAAQATKVMDALNVLYVALTRPRQALFIMLPPARPKKTKDGTPGALSGASLIRAAIGLQDDGATGFSLGDATWHARSNGKSAALAAVPSLPLSITLAPPRKRVRTTTFVAPSSLEGGESCAVGQALFRQSRAAADEGTIYHALFEGLEWLPWSSEAEATAARQLDRFTLDASQRQQFVEMWRQMLTPSEIATALQRSTYEGAGRTAGTCCAITLRSMHADSFLREAASIADSLDRRSSVDLALVEHRSTRRLHRVGDVARRDGTEEFSVLAGVDRQL